MNEKYKSQKNKGFGIWLFIVSLLLLFLGFGLPFVLQRHIGQLEIIIKTVILVPIIGFFIWCWTGTYYVIGKEKLLIKCGPIKFQVKIQSIKVIRTNQNTIGGIIKPTLSWKCIEIEYGDHLTLSISPEDQEKFIAILTDLNKGINVKYNV